MKILKGKSSEEVSWKSQRKAIRSRLKKSLKIVEKESHRESLEKVKVIRSHENHQSLMNSQRNHQMAVVWNALENAKGKSSEIKWKSQWKHHHSCLMDSHWKYQGRMKTHWKSTGKVDEKSHEKSTGTIRPNDSRLVRKCREMPDFCRFLTQSRGVVKKTLRCRGEKPRKTLIDLNFRGKRTCWSALLLPIPWVKWEIASSRDFLVCRFAVLPKIGQKLGQFSGFFAKFTSFSVDKRDKHDKCNSFWKIWQPLLWGFVVFLSDHKATNVVENTVQRWRRGTTQWWGAAQAQKQSNNFCPDCNPKSQTKCFSPFYAIKEKAVFHAASINGGNQPMKTTRDQLENIKRRLFSVGWTSTKNPKKEVLNKETKSMMK